MDCYEKRMEKIKGIESMLNQVSDEALDETIGMLRNYLSMTVTDTGCKDLFYVKISKILNKESPYFGRVNNCLKRANKVYIFDLFERDYQNKYGISISTLFLIRNIGVNSLDYLIEGLINVGVKEENFMLYGMDNSRYDITLTKNSYINKSKHEFLKKML